MFKTEPVKVLTIAGSDSGGAAGLQADLRTFAVLGAYGLCALTVATAQNSLAVHQIHPLPTNFIAAQLDTVLTDYGTDAVKTGFIGRFDLIQLIATKLREYHLSNIVIDPVLVNHKGESMFSPEITQAYLHYLFPLADLITPNRHEAVLLTGKKVETVADMETAAFHLHTFGPQYVLIKGGIIEQNMVDVLFDGKKVTHFSTPYIHTSNLHGSGDTLSAAICVYLAMGQGIEEAVKKAQEFTAVAIQTAAPWQLGAGHGPVAQWLVK